MLRLRSASGLATTTEIHQRFAKPEARAPSAYARLDRSARVGLGRGQGLSNFDAWQ